MSELMNERGGVTIEQMLERDGEIPQMTVGVSMEPMLHTRKNIIIIKKVTEPLKKYDVVLYKRGEKYILHRLVKITENSNYVFRGDNCVNDEHDITDENVLGVLKGYYKGKNNEKYIDCKSNVPYRIYARFWVASHGCRMFLRKAKHKIGRIIKHKDNS